MNNLTSTRVQINSDIKKRSDETDHTDIMTIIGVFRDRLPYVLERDDDGKIYILLAEFSEGLEKWISTGKTEELDFKTLPDDKEREFRSMCSENGYKVTNGSQKMHFMNHDAEIAYIGAIEPKSGVSVTLMPWFMIPRKKYPVFAYLYADGYRREHKAGIHLFKRLIDELSKLSPNSFVNVRYTCEVLIAQCCDNSA